MDRHTSEERSSRRDEREWNKSLMILRRTRAFLCCKSNEATCRSKSRAWWSRSWLLGCPTQRRWSVASIHPQMFLPMFGDVLHSWQTLLTINHQCTIIWSSSSELLPPEMRTYVGKPLQDQGERPVEGVENGAGCLTAGEIGHADWGTVAGFNKHQQ